MQKNRYILRSCLYKNTVLKKCITTLVSDTLETVILEWAQGPSACGLFCQLDVNIVGAVVLLKNEVRWNVLYQN